MSPRTFWPIILIAAGLLFLLDNFGLLPGNAWGWIWAVALIGLGLSFLFGRRPANDTETTQAALPLDGATGARLAMRHGAGRLEVKAGADRAVLFAGTFGGGLDQQVRREGDRLEVTLQSGSSDWTEYMLPWNWFLTQSRREWTVAINPDVPLTLKLDTGASENRLDLSGLRVSELEMNTGASSSEVTLPANAGHVRARITAGAASVKVLVPSGVAARIRGRVGAGALNIDQGRFPKHGDAYESADFQATANRVELSVEGGAGEISVR